MRAPSAGWLAPLLALIGAASAAAAAPVASLSGQVTGPGGAPVARATIAVRAGATSFETRSDPGGRFTLSGLPPGAAALRVEAPGYAAEQRDLVVTDGMTLDIALRPAAFAEALTVTAARTATSRRTRRRAWWCSRATTWR